ncbi:MAG TPA: hypothetical protein VFQ92_12735 [Blastocatellia bacterium]|nr:hypothetical protein [Blastocatellia bacterium]
METIKTNCPECGNPFELPRDLQNVICARCGTAYQVREYKGALNLTAIERRLDHPAVEGEISEPVSIEDRVAELDELIEETGSQIEAIRGREKGAPLQMGCALFSLFVMAIIVITLFMPLGREYFGGWLFYLALAAALVLGFMRVRRRFANPEHLEQMRQDRARLEALLEEIQSERGRLIELKEKIDS